MLFNKRKIFALIFIFVFFVFDYKNIKAIEPVEIGEPNKEKIEINLSILDEMSVFEGNEIKIDKDVRTKIKKTRIQKNNKEIKEKKTYKNIKKKQKYSYIDKSNTNYLNKIEIFFESNSSNIKKIEAKKIKNFIEKKENKNKLALKITAYAKTKQTGGNDSSRRLSLDRAINVRSELINNGILPENLIVKALGNLKKNNTKNKVDIEVIEKI